ncbi:MAG: HAMP domain-containing protein [Candidatus Brocadiales bacterium]|nr:HAMP domain-containing protein [Candidatus Brocadiales bacterium]
MFSKNTISTRLFNGYFIIIIFLGIITIVALVKLGSINYLKRSLTDDSRIRIEHICNLEIYIEKLRAITYRHVNKSNKREITENCVNIMNTIRGESLELMTACADNPLLLQLSNAIKNNCEILYSQYKASPYPSKKLLLPRINNLSVIIGAIKHESTKNIYVIQGSFEGVIRSASLTILFFFLITVISSIYLSIKIASSITNPLAKLVDSAQKIVEGNLSVRLNVNKHDEIGTLSTVFNKMVDTLSSDQLKIKEYNRNLEAKNRELKKLSHKVISVQEDERRHLSQVLHEDIGQAMSALKINIKLLENYNLKTVTDQNNGFQSCMEDCRKIVDMVFKSIKNLSFNLNYSQLEKLGLLATVSNYTEQISKRLPLRIITYSSMTDENIPADIKMYLFRIIREAITNVIKHADATLVRLVFVSESNNIIAMRIIDNGHGFNVENLWEKETEEFKLGITTIKELVDLMRGSFQIISKINKGTTLTISVPC